MTVRLRLKRDGVTVLRKRFDDEATAVAWLKVSGEVKDGDLAITATRFHKGEVVSSYAIKVAGAQPRVTVAHAGTEVRY